MEKRRTTPLAVAAVILTLGALWYSHLPVPPPRAATWEEVQAEAKRGGYRLINTTELAQRYRQDFPRLLLVDTRQDWEYRSGHIKGAVNFPIEPTWWSRWRSRGRLAALLGPDQDRLVVFY
jgi:3-mercaptopyruvate sulfurtransferase SseA